ncbi:septin interacting protein 2 isoform X2 [Musca autumnalis]
MENISDESFEALERMCEKTASDPNSTLFRYLQHNEQPNQNNCISPLRKFDESFEVLEKMCDKTASDPNSTLFQYIHSDHKEQILAEAKKRSTEAICAVSTKNNDLENENKLLAKLSDCTLLDDVEAPSRLWENTIAADAGFRTSPVKMVGLMRPSTIIEEPCDESRNSDISSQTSFQTATTKGGLLSDVSSSYDTAHESTVASSRADVSNERREINVDDILTHAINKTRNATSNLVASNGIPTETQTFTSIDCDLKKEYESNEIPTTIETIDLESTLSPQHEFSSHEKEIVDDVVIIDDGQREMNVAADENSDEDEEEISVIDILSDDEIENSIPPTEKCDDIKIELASNNGSYNEISQDNKENYSFCTSLSDRSIKFNDTMEEVEYMLKKGMEYMAEKQNMPLPKTEIKNESPILKESELPKTQPNSPVVKDKRIITAHSETKAKVPKSSTFIKTSNKKVQQSSNRFAFDMRPFPKLDVFGKSPQPTHPRQKELSSKQHFSHIVSPVGAYMKKTASTPLMSTGKIKSKNANVLNSSAFRELEYESRLCQAKIGTNSAVINSPNGGLSPLPGSLATIKSTLPKKAYISSEFKHIVDERTPVTIPGGKKIQKYLENAMMPAVLRHDGKIKIPGGLSSKSTMAPPKPKISSSKAPSETRISTSQRSNSSLADLSVMSGDVSMYTIMDAQKF